MLEVIVAKSREKLLQQIQAIKWQIKQDTSEKDRKLHMKALKVLKQELERLETKDK